MENTDTLFYFLVIVASIGVVIWAIRIWIENSVTLQERRKNKALEALAKEQERKRNF